MTFFELLQEKKILLADGAWGTELTKKGLRVGECPELLNVENPGIVGEVAESYVDAGSDIILTNTFGGSPKKLAKFGLENRVEELNETGARISVEAAGGKALVFASIGSTGEFLTPLGSITESEMTRDFARQVRALVKCGIDGFVVESMSDLGEISCVLRAVKDNSNLPVVCTMTFDRGLKGYATMMGVTPVQAVEALEKADADVIGSNCGSGIENLIDVAREMRPCTGLPLWIKPNAGLPELVNGQTIFRETPEVMSSRISELLEAGTDILGGCCGTTPEHIRMFREVIDRKFHGD